MTSDPNPIELEQQVRKLLTSKQGILEILTASLLLSDFQKMDEAQREAIKTYQSNQAYFEKLIKFWQQENPDSGPA